MSDTQKVYHMGDAQEIVKECAFPDYTFAVIGSGSGSFGLQGFYEEKDTLTGIVELQRTRFWDILGMTKSEIVATAFKCVMTSMEHRTREWFLYRNRAIYQPHYDVDQLHAISEERSS